MWSVIAFAGFYLFTQPANAAVAVGGAFGAIGSAFESAITFLTSLVNIMNEGGNA